MDACGNGRLVGWQGVHLVWGGLGGDRVRGVSVEGALPGRNAEHTILAVFCERFGAVARSHRERALYTSGVVAYGKAV